MIYLKATVSITIQNLYLLGIQQLVKKGKYLLKRQFIFLTMLFRPYAKKSKSQNSKFLRLILHAIIST